MTKLKGKLTRELGVPYDHRGNAIVIDLEAPGSITFREKGKKHPYTLPAPLVMQLVIQKIADTVKPAPKKMNRGLLHA